MKTRVIIYSTLVLGLLFLYLRLSAPQRETEKRRSKQFAELIASNTPSSEVLTNPAYKKWEKPSNTSESDWQYATVIRQMMLATNKKIDYHARVIDQNGIGVAGAILEVEISGVDEQKVLREFPAMKMGSELFSEKIQLTSDSDGWIRLIDRRGTMVVVKDLQPGSGYIWQLKGYPSFDYKGGPDLTDFQDPKKGYVIHVWKKGETESLVQWSKTASLPRNVARQGYSIFGSSVAPEQADIVIESQLVHPEIAPTGENPRAFDRLIRIVVQNGQIKLTPDIYPNFASVNEPDGNRFEFLYQSDKRESEGWQKNFYVKARNGNCFASLKVKFIQSPMSLQFESHVNPTGSRNLEPDPEKLITDPEEIRRIDQMNKVK